MDLKYNESKQIIDKAIWLGFVKESKAPNVIDLISKSEESFNMFKALLRDGQSDLIKKFDEYSREGKLEQIKMSDRPYFIRLWRAKFEKDPVIGNGPINNIKSTLVQEQSLPNEALSNLYNYFVDNDLKEVLRSKAERQRYSM